jgi:DNA replicative helicase MCM subunit Mcm2 (Cdc46/Mcm family)
MENKVITCIQCQEDFEFTVEEQEKLKRRGFDAPLRCPQCRKHKSRHLQQEENRMSKSKKRQYRTKFDEYYD